MYMCSSLSVIPTVLLGLYISGLCVCLNGIEFSVGPIPGWSINTFFIHFSNGSTSKPHLDLPEIVCILAVTLGKKAPLQAELTIHISVWDISVSFQRTLEGGGGCQSFPDSNPSLSQPPISLQGSPLCGQFLLACEVMIKLEPAMF